MQKGDIILIVFPFTDLSGNKLRPALVIAETLADLTVLFITTQLKWKEVTDVVLLPDDSNGIKKQSLLRTSKIATLDKTLVKGRLGFINEIIQNEVDAKLKTYLQIP
jgi:mRNA interferase MazF